MMKSSICKFNRGDIFYYNFGIHSITDRNIETKQRPVVIVSNDIGNNNGPTVIIAPITTRDISTCKPWQVAYKDGDRHQVILCEQLRCVNSASLFNYLGRLDEHILAQVDVALSLELNLDTTSRSIDKIDFLKQLNDSFNTVISKKLNNYETFLNNVILNKLDEMKKVVENKMSTLEIDTDISAKLNEIIALVNSITTKNDMNYSEDDNVNTTYNDNENHESNETDEANEDLNIEKLVIDNSAINDKDNETINVEIKINENEEFNKNENNKPIKTTTNNKKKKYNLNSTRQKIDYSDINALKEFLKLYDCYGVDYMAELYGVTKKQMTNRKWLVKKYLKENNL